MALYVDGVPPEPKKITPFTHWVSGEATLHALQESVRRLVASAPAECDVLVQAFGLVVTEVGYLPPHSLMLAGFDHEGNQAYVVAHYSQLVAHVVYRKKRGPERVVTGFWTEKKNA